MANGDIYDGEFLDDEAHGFGVKTFGSNGDIHYGLYQNNLRHGKGLYRWSSGDEYEGDYVMGEQCGSGRYRWNNDTMIFDGRWMNGQKHGPGFLRVVVHSSSSNGNNPTRGRNPNVRTPSERVFFEVWCKGKRLFREMVDFKWDDLPPMEELSQYHCWKHVWETSEANEGSGVGEFARTGNATMPVFEDANTSFEPFADETHPDSFQSQASLIRVSGEPLESAQPRRHYSVDFYSSPPMEDEERTSRPRSSSCSSYMSGTERNSRFRRGRCSTRKVHHNRGGGFVVITAIRKKTRISRLSTNLNK